MARSWVANRSSTKRGLSHSWLVRFLILASIGIWLNEEFSWIEITPQHSSPKVDESAKAGGYHVYRDCELVEHRSNDGDSFLVRLPDGRERTFRLYFVDAPESAFRRYRNGETNFDRIQSQAREMGGISPEAAVELGKKAKSFTLSRLNAQDFTIYTRWDSPFRDNRFHAFVQIREGGRTRWLHELLIERKLARIRTKPADLPDGTPANTQLQKLQKL